MLPLPSFCIPHAGWSHGEEALAAGAAVAAAGVGYEVRARRHVDSRSIPPLTLLALVTSEGPMLKPRQPLQVTKPFPPSSFTAAH